MAPEMSIGRVNWVRCPICKWRFYLGAPLFQVEGKIQATCPKCHEDFNPGPNLETKATGGGLLPPLSDELRREKEEH